MYVQGGFFLNLVKLNTGIASVLRTHSKFNTAIESDSVYSEIFKTNF